jgi:hypothetical protein
MNDVCGNPEVRLLVELDHGDHVGRRHVGMKRLMVHGEREDRAGAAHRLILQLAVTGRAPNRWGVGPAVAGRATLDQELALRPTGPEGSIEIVQTREHSRTNGLCRDLRWRHGTRLKDVA